MKKLTLRRQEDVWEAIRRRGKEIASQLPDKEIFTSGEFRSYATRLADFILRKHKLYSLDIQYDTDPSAPVAYTDGKKIVLNVANELAAAPKLLERRFKVNMGVLFHECAHKLFLDFSVHKRIIKAMVGGTLYGDLSQPLSEEYAEALEEIRTVLSSPYCEALTGLFADMANRINDGHDELAMKRCFPGFIGNCITVAGEVQFELWPVLEELIDKRLPDHQLYGMLILQYAKFGAYKVNGTSAEEAYLERMKEAEPIIDAALNEDDYAKRWDYINLLMMFQWPSLRTLFPDDPQNQQPQGGASSGQQAAGGGSGGGAGAGGCQGGGLSPEALKAVLEAMEQDAEAMLPQAPAPVNGTGSAVDPSAVVSGATTGSGDEGLAQIVQSLSEEKAAGEIQKELDAAQMDAIRNTNLPLIHKHVPYTVIRHNKENEALYRTISDEVAPVVRNLAKEMVDLLRELNERWTQHHKAFGPILEPSEAYRPDRKFFAKKTIPQDLPNMALCVLIDQSGSMGGSKLDNARRMAIALERFASTIGIPLMVAGHDVDYQVNLRIFTDFLSATTQKDRYSLAGISSGGCNRDGLPIRLCCEMLAQRQEDVRMLVVISDGSPNDDDYSGREARKDISDTVAQYRRKGLLIYGAAIDDDRDIIEEIYGKNFLSIDRLDTLSRTMIRLVRQQIA